MESVRWKCTNRVSEMDSRLTIKNIKNTGTTRLMFRPDTILILNLVCKIYGFVSVEERLDTHVSEDKAIKSLRLILHVLLLLLLSHVSSYWCLDVRPCSSMYKISNLLNCFIFQFNLFASKNIWHTNVPKLLNNHRNRHILRVSVGLAHPQRLLERCIHRAVAGIQPQFSLKFIT